MGGVQTVEQLQTFITDRVFKVTSDVLVQKQTTIDQSATTVQVTRFITPGLAAGPWPRPAL